MKAGSYVLLPALLFALAAKPYAQSFGGRHAALREQRSLLARETGLIAAEKQGELRAAARAASAFTERHMLIARDETLLYARATSYFQSLAKISEATLEDGTVISADSTDDGLRVLVLSLRGRGELAGVRRLIQLIESGPATVSIERLQLVPVDADAAISFVMDVRVYGTQVTR